jgi:hypothetical protein
MSGAGLSWIFLSPSRERRLWLSGAAAVSACLAAVFGAGAVSAAEPVLGIAAAAAALSAIGALLEARRAPDAMQLAIDADGAIWMRRGESSAQRLQPRLAGDRLVTFSSAAGPVLVWRDNLPADAFRRLSAHARWHVERAPRQPQATP